MLKVGEVRENLNTCCFFFKQLYTCCCLIPLMHPGQVWVTLDGKTDAGCLQRLWDNLQIHVPPLTGWTLTGWWDIIGHWQVPDKRVPAGWLRQHVEYWHNLQNVPDPVASNTATIICYSSSQGSFRPTWMGHGVRLPRVSLERECVYSSEGTRRLRKVLTRF